MSTGKIACDITKTLIEKGYDGSVAFARNSIQKNIPYYKIGNKYDVYFHVLMARITDRVGFYSKNATIKLLKYIDEEKPDIIHFHNLHGYYINIELLINYIRQNEIPVVYTLHDCWSFTGHCCNFEFIKCYKWKKQCINCPQLKEYPKVYFDNSKNNYEKKKNLFTSIPMTVVTPSIWLKNYVKESFLRNQKVITIRNGIDLNVFKPTYGTWVLENNLKNKKIILSVAGTWTKKKGLEDICKLSERLSDDYKIVMVGVNKKLEGKIPKKILTIQRTTNMQELAEIYTAAFCLINLTYEDNFPTVNLEALACGTPVIMYDTGGGIEIINKKNGCIVKKGNIEEVYQSIKNLNCSFEDCLKSGRYFDRKLVFDEYIELYQALLNGEKDK